MLILASSVICPLVDDFSLFIYRGFPVLVCFSFRIVLGSVCLMP